MRMLTDMGHIHKIWGRSGLEGTHRALSCSCHARTIGFDTRALHLSRSKSLSHSSIPNSHKPGRQTW